MVQFSNSADVDKAKLRKSKLCNYCNLCTGPTDSITNLPAPKGHAWKSMSELTVTGLTPNDFKKGTGGAIGGDQVPKKFEAEGSLKGLGDRSWWTMLYPNSSGANQDGTPNANHVNIRNCTNLYEGTDANEQRWKAAGGDTCVSKTTQQTCDSVNVCKWNYGSSKCEDKGGGSFSTQKILDQHITFSSIEGDPGDWKSAVTERDLSERGLKLGNVQKTKSTWKQYITDQSISAQKVYDLPRSRLDVVPNQHSAVGNINGYGSAGWFPKTGQTDNWMILDLGDVFKVTSLSTRPGKRLKITDG